MRWYLRYSLSLRDVEELINERGLEADHTTVWRWFSATSQNWNRGCVLTSSQSTNPGVWMRRIFGVKGRWCYLYRAIDSTGATIDFLLSPVVRKYSTRRK